MKNWRGIAAVLVALALAVLAAGCGSSGGTETSGSAANDTQAKQGGTLRFGLESEPTTLNPSEIVENSAATVLVQYAEGLYELTEDGEPKLDLAKSVKESPDGITYSFTLQAGVTFSDGQPMTAKDVVFSLEQARKSPYVGSFYENIASVSATDGHTVVVKLTEPSPTLSAELAAAAASVIPANYNGMSAKEFGQNPVGTGPFEIKTWKHGSGLTLTRNENFWKAQKPPLEAIEFKPVTDETARFTQLRSGELDVIRASPFAAKTGAPEGSGIRVEATQQLVANYVMFGPSDPLFEDQRAREAVDLAIDREGIIKAATDEHGELGASYLAPALRYATALQPPAPNAAKAKQLVEGVVAGGADASFTLNYYDFDEYSKVAAQIIQQNLAEVGFQVKLQPLDEAALNEKLESGEYEAVLGLYSPGNPDPAEITSFYLAFFADEWPGIDALNKLASEAATEVDTAARAKLYAQLQEAVAAEELMLIVNFQPFIYPAQEKVTGLHFDAVGNVHLFEAGFNE